MMMILSLIFLCSCASTALSHSILKQNLFAAIDHMKPLVELEKILVSNARSYVMQQREIFNGMRSIVEEVKDAVHLVDNQTPQGYLNNPINSFKLTQRFTHDWRDLHSYMLDVDRVPSGNQLEDGLGWNKEEMPGAQQFLDTYRQYTPPKSSWVHVSELYTTQSTWLQMYRSLTPSYKDIQGATVAFLRLQDSYNITAREFAEGKVSFLRPFKLQLTAEDCLDIAKLSLVLTRYVRMKQWLLEAERLITNPTIPHRHGNTTEQQVNEYLAYSYYLENDLATALWYTEKVLAEDPTNTQFLRCRELYSYYYKKNIPMPFDEPQFMARAQGILEVLQSGPYLQACNNFNPQLIGYKNESNLRCFLKQDHPLLMLKPVKVTQMHDNPDVFVFHSIVSEKNVDDLITLATPRIKGAKVVHMESNMLVEADYRVSKSMFLLPDVPEDMRINDKFHPLFEAVTGLSMRHAETLQINNYGLGGQYEMHHDYGEPGTLLDIDPIGNRIATLLLYMSEVEFGGHTVFPDIGLSVEPAKGDAVFWYNLHRNGTGFFETRHASCPILSGSKWVANKWIRNAGNEFKRPCSLNQFE